jgi:hypothetical protein
VTRLLPRLNAQKIAAGLLGIALVVGAFLVVGVATRSTAHAAGTPPFEPVGNPPQAGGLTFYNSSGQVITGGSITDSPIAAYVQGSVALNNATKAELTGYTPVINVNPGNWLGYAFGNSVTPNTSAPGALGTSSLPLYTGVSGYSLSELIGSYPNNDTSNDGYAGIYVLRLQSYQHPNYSTSYDSADIQVSGNTWSVVYTPQAQTTTTLTDNSSGASVQGASVTLTATVTDSSAPGTVQFEANGSPLGSPVPVTNGTATYQTTSLPLGSSSLSALFTPTAGSAFAPSTGTDSFAVTSPNTGATPEAPNILLLPLVALVVGGGSVIFIRRRRHQRAGL